jgi:pantoate--beta-alanine ligase
VVFAPDAISMYPSGYQTYVEVRALSQPLCGQSRPGHFAGVASVVSKLFHMTVPHVAIFGEKDYQQLAILRRMNRDLDFGIEIVGCPIVREPDGVAMSSRNAYLSTEDRASARCLSQGLKAAQEAFAAGERRSDRLVELASQPARAVGNARIDYVDLRDADELFAIDEVKRPAVLAMAVFIGQTRLIDNCVLTPGVQPP